MWLFGIFGAVISLAMLVLYVGTGEITDFNMHLAAYAYLFVCLGSIINMLRKKDKQTKELLDYIQFIMDKRNKELFEEVRSVKTVIFNMTGARKNPAPAQKNPLNGVISTNSDEQ